MLPREPGYLQRLPLIIAAALVMLWPAVLNGGVFFATDSIAYIRGPDQAIAKVLGPGHGTVWSDKKLGMGMVHGQATVAPADEGRTPPMAGRSLYYGLLANLGARTGGFWLTVFVQALAAMLALDLMCRALGWERPQTFVAAAGLAALATPLAFIVDCVMPDALTPTLILTAGALAAGGDRLKRGELFLAFLILAYAAMVHTTHLLLLLAIAGSGGLLLIARRWVTVRVGAPGVLTLAATGPLLVGLASGAVFNAAVVRAYGQPPVQPPFLTARLLGDGRPGDAWLRMHCPKAGFQACAYAPRLPMATDEFLWSADPHRSAFWTATTAERTALGREQFALALAVVRDDPAGVLRQFVIDGATQFGDMSLFEINHKDSVRRGMEGWMAGPDADRWRASMAWRKAWPTGLMDFIQLSGVALAVGGLVALTLRAGSRHSLRPDDDRLRILQAGAVILIAVTANAVVCGGLSDIFGRYQARVTAPLILIGLMALASLFLAPGRFSNAR